MSGPVYLAIESSAAHSSVALTHNGELQFSEQIESGRRQSESLMEPLEAALRLVSPGEIDLVVVGTGPGSYNGARVGIAAGQGIGIAHDCPTIGLCSLEALSAVRSGTPCLALGDARRGTFFTIELTNGKLSGTPDLLEHKSFLTAVEAAVENGHCLLTLEAPERLRLSESLTEQIAQAAPDAALLLEAWNNHSEAEQQVLLGTPPQPFYLRPPHITKAKN